MGRRRISGCWRRRPYRLADRGQLHAADDRRPEGGMSLEFRVMADDELSLLAHVIEELGLLERVHRDIGHSMLAGAHELAHNPQAPVLLGELEPVPHA